MHAGPRADLPGLGQEVEAVRANEGVLHFLPGLRRLSSGFAIIICGVAASALGAACFPVADTTGPDEEVLS